MKKTIAKLILSVLTSGICSLAFATNYYASPTGTGTGTLADPCSLVSGVAKVTTPGDTLFLRAGQYNIGSKISFNKVGTANARLAFFAYPGESVIIDFRTQVYGERGFQVNSNYLHFKGLTIQYAGDNGMHIISNYNIIENCVFHANSDAGLQITGSASGGVGNLIKNCDSYDNFDYKTGGLAAADFGGNADGFADKLFDNTSDTNTYEGCRAWNNGDDGWDMFNRRGIINLNNSWCYKNGPATYDMTNHPRYTTDKAWFDQFPTTITVSGTSTTKTVTLAAYYNNGNGNGFKVGGDYRNNTVTLTNCLSANNKVRGYDQNNNAGTMTLLNCSAYNNAPNYGFSDKVSSNSAASNPASESPATTSKLIIKNCVSLGGTANTFVSAANLTSANNSWSGAVTCNSSDFISIDPTVMTGTRQADGSLPNIVFMQLATGSDLIDKGVNVSLPYSGTAPDMGCFELGNLDQFPGAVTTPTNGTQTVVQNTAITPIVFTWSAGATGLSATNLPDGIIATLDNTAKTLTLSGTPTAAGVFDYTITTLGGSGAPATVTGKIVSGSATARKIAYVTTPNSPADALILNKLQSNLDFLTTIVDASVSTNNFSGYDLVIMSPVPTSSSAAFPTLETLDKPKLLLKPFVMKAAVWNWGESKNLAITATTVSNKTHEIFNGLTFSGANNDLLELFSTASTSGSVTGVNTWNGTAPSVITLAAATGVEATKTATVTVNNIVEVPVGTNMNGTITTQRFLTIGLSEYSTANLTATATQLIENSCYYLMGMSPPTTACSNTKALDFCIVQSENNILVKSNETITKLELISIAGTKVASSQSNSISNNGIATGIYILKINTGNKSTFTKLMIK